MILKEKQSLKEKEKKLIAKIEKNKKALSHLQKKRRLEIGKLVCQHGLDAFDDTVLDQAFAQLAKRLADEYNKS